MTYLEYINLLILFLITSQILMMMMIQIKSNQHPVFIIININHFVVVRENHIHKIKKTFGYILSSKQKKSII